MTARTRPGAVPDPAGLTTHSYGDLLGLDLPPSRPLIQGLIEEEEGGIWGGPPNVGKTWLLLAAARAIASGQRFLGQFPTVQATVLVVDEESHLRGLVERARMLEAGDPVGREVPLHFAVGQGVRVDGVDAAVQRLHETMLRLRPKLVIADSLTRVHGQNENDAGAMADVFYNVKQLMRAHGASFLFSDHVRKKGLINDPEEMLRGSTEKRAWPDSILAIEPDDEGGDGTRLLVTMTKNRHGRRLTPFAVALEVDSTRDVGPFTVIGGGSARLVYAGEATRKDASKANDIIRGVHDLKAQLGDDAADAATLAMWMNCHRTTVERHAVKLVKAGLLAERTVVPSEKGGRPKSVYDVAGGRD